MDSVKNSSFKIQRYELRESCHTLSNTIKFVKSTPTNLFGTILFEMNNLQNSHLSPQPSRRVVIRPGNYT